MDEEKNKLDAFCEQSLKNVSGHWFIIIIDYYWFTQINIKLLANIIDYV